MLLAITAPLDSEDGPSHFDEALAAVHQTNALPLTLEYGIYQGQVGLYCRCPEALQNVVRQQLYAAYPQVWLHRRSDDALDPPTGYHCWTIELRLRPDVYPIRRYSEHFDQQSGQSSDSIRKLLTLFSPHKSDRTHPRLEIAIRPAPPRYRRWAEHAVERLDRPFFRAHRHFGRRYAAWIGSRWWWKRTLAYSLGLLVRPGPPQGSSALQRSGRRQHDGEDDIQAASDKVGKYLFEVRIRVVVSAEPEDREQALAKLRAITGAISAFAQPRYGAFRPFRIRHTSNPPPLGFSWWYRGFPLSQEEVATLFHPTTETVRTHRLERSEFRLLEPPVGLPTGKEEGSVAIARVKFHGRREVFGIRQEDRRRHVWIGGKTGMGKTSLMKRMIHTDILAGRGIGVIDPHGDLADDVLRLVPRKHFNRVVLFDPGDREFPIAFNPLDCRDKQQIPLVASNVLSVFKKLYEDVSWGPRLESILRNALLALLEVEGTSLVSLWQMLTDQRYRNWIVRQVENEFVRKYWEQKFAKWNERFRNEATEAVLNKIEGFTTNPILQNMLGQSRNKLDLQRIMDEGKILICNLSKGGIGEDGSHLLGSLLVTSIQQAAMSRDGIPEADRRDFYLYVDEFQNFATPSFATILAEARKYRLNLVVANQYLKQMPDETAHAVFGNVGTMLVFAMGASDAELMAAETGERASKHDIVNLPQYHAYANVMAGGKTSQTFSIATMKPDVPRPSPLLMEKVRRVSRDMYATPRAEVERKMRSLLASSAGSRQPPEDVRKKRLPSQAA